MLPLMMMVYIIMQTLNLREKYSEEEEEQRMHGSDENEHGRNQEVSWQSQENYISTDNFEVHSNECSKK
jgi:hypothetical protein